MLQIKFPRELTRNKLLAGVDEAVIGTIFDARELKEKREGEIIYRTGDSSTGIFLLLNGEVRVKYSSNNYVSRKQSNDFFGEKELIENTLRISSAVAFSKVYYYRIDKDIFKKLISKNSAFNNNVLNLGEIKLPEINKSVDRKFSIVEKAKPVSFRASPEVGNAWEKGNEEQNAEAPVVPDEPLEGESQESTIKDIDEYLTPDDLSQKFDGKLSDTVDEFKDWKINSDDVERTDKVVDSKADSGRDNNKKVKAEDAEEEKEKVPPKSKDDNGINREMIRRVFASIEAIFNSISISDLIEKTVKTLKDLTSSEGGNLILVDEQLSIMKKISVKDKKYSEEVFQLPEGLTGSSAFQKKILNLERPTEDSRYNSKIDQPGPARLKRILYFPVINEMGETVAVIQLGQENKKYSDTDIAHINMLSKQIVSAIDRAYRLEDYLTGERENSNKRLKEILLNEIKDPISIINNYTDILSEKKLSEEIDEVIRMLQKQANSIEDLTETLLSISSPEKKLDLRGIHFNEFIEDVLELLSEFCQARDVTLFKKIGNGAIVNINRGKFYSALYQIIRYCCEDAKKDGKIYFSTALENESIITKIEAKGKGLLEKVEGDFRDIILGKNIVEQPNAGLLLAKQIIFTHNGQFKFNSSKGKGTTFTITLPISNSSLN